MAGNATAFGFAGSPDRNYADSIGVWRAGSQRVDKIATTSYPKGTVSGVAFDGNTVVFVDIERVGSTEAVDRVEWTIRSVGVDGGGDKVLARSPAGGSVFPPLVNQGDGQFMWTVWESSKDPWAGRRVYAWQPGDPQPSIVRRGIWLNDAAIPVPQGMVFTRTEQDQRWPSGMYKSDLYFWRTGEPDPVNLSNSGLVLEFDASHDQVRWTEAHPNTRQAGTRTDPYAVFSQAFDEAAAPVEVAKGFNSGNLTGGEGWIAWWTKNLQLEVLRLEDHASTTVMTQPAFVPARPDGDAESLVAGRMEDGQVILERYTTRN